MPGALPRHPCGNLGRRWSSHHWAKAGQALPEVGLESRHVWLWGPCPVHLPGDWCAERKHGLPLVMLSFMAG